LAKEADSVSGNTESGKQNGRAGLELRQAGKMNDEEEEMP